MKKIAHYRLVELSHHGDFVPPSNLTFEQCLDTCLTNYKQPLPTFHFDNSECLIASHDKVNGITRIHLVLYEKGAGAAIIDTLKGAKINETPPPNNGEFIEAQIFAICSENHIIWLTHNNYISVNAIALLFREMFDCFYKSAKINGLFLLAKADSSKIGKLLSDGVASIELNFFDYKETFEFAKKQGKIENAGFVSPLLDYMNSGTDSSDEMDSLSTRVIIKPGRKWGEPLIKEHLNRMASAAIDNVSETGEVTIVTKKNAKIKSSKLMISHEVAVSGNKRVLDIGDTFKKLEQAHDNLKQDNLLSR